MKKIITGVTYNINLDKCLKYITTHQNNYINICCYDIKTGDNFNPFEYAGGFITEGIMITNNYVEINKKDK